MNHIATSTPPTWATWRDALLEIIAEGLLQNDKSILDTVRQASPAVISEACLRVIRILRTDRSVTEPYDLGAPHDPVCEASADAVIDVIGRLDNENYFGPDAQRAGPAFWYSLGAVDAVAAPLRRQSRVGRPARLPAVVIDVLRADLDGKDELGEAFHFYMKWAAAGGELAAGATYPWVDTVGAEGITKNILREVAGRLITQTKSPGGDGIAVVGDILAEHGKGAKNISSLAPELYPAVLAALNAALVAEVKS